VWFAGHRAHQVLHHTSGEVVRTGETEFAAWGFAYGASETGYDVCIHDLGAVLVA